MPKVGSYVVIRNLFYFLNYYRDDSKYYACLVLTWSLEMVDPPIELVALVFHSLAFMVMLLVAVLLCLMLEALCRYLDYSKSHNILIASLIAYLCD